MIQIESVRIRDLRGIRELEVQPGRENFVVSGPNGSGKSGVVDAIEFALTGEMSRLSGKGTGGLSVSRHGPHVDRRDDPASAEVSLQFYVPELDRSAVLTRNVKNAKKFSLEPDEFEIRAIVEELTGHPELTLTRRELIRYILVRPGQRSKEIQELLKLESIGDTRRALKTAWNKLGIVAREAKNAVADSDAALRCHLDVPNLAQEDILAAINPHRRTLELAEIVKLGSDNDLSAGILEGAGDAGFNKGAALRDVEALEGAKSGLPALCQKEVKSVANDLVRLDGEPALFEAITRRSFVEGGLGIGRRSAMSAVRHRLGRCGSAESTPDGEAREGGRSGCTPGTAFGKRGRDRQPSAEYREAGRCGAASGKTLRSSWVWRGACEMVVGSEGLCYGSEDGRGDRRATRSAGCRVDHGSRVICGAA